jgi:hypothetical protein
MVKGSTISVEQRARLSKSHLGNTSCRGRKLTSEHKVKISLSLLGNQRRLGKKFTTETLAKMSKAHTGYKHTAEAKIKISQANLGRNLGGTSWNKGLTASDEAKANMSKAALGKKITAETRAKISRAALGRKHTNETRARIALAHLGMKPTTETRVKLSKVAHERKFSIATRIKMSMVCQGDKSHFWRGGISFLPYSPEFNNSLKESIKLRDGYCCQLCAIRQTPGWSNRGSIPFLHIHHIDYNKKNNDRDNLISLCCRCHGQTTSGNRDYWREHFRTHVGATMELKA